MMRKYLFYSEMISSQLAIYSFMILMTSYMLACSVLFDPTVCSSNEECEGGICQAGICVGSRVPTQTVDMMSSSDQRMNDAQVEDAMLIDMQAPIDDMMVIDMFAGMTVDMQTDMNLTQDIFDCTFNLSREALEAQELVLFNDNKIYTKNNNLVMSGQLLYPINGSWASQTKLLVNQDEIDLVIDDMGFFEASITLDREGSYNVRLLIGETGNVKCATQVNLILDQSVPILNQLFPEASEVWIGYQAEEVRTQVRVQNSDLSPISLFVNNEEEARAINITAAEWNLDLILQEGVNPITISAIDLLGHRSDISLTYYYDPTAPALQLQQPSLDTINSDQNIITVQGIVFQQINSNMIERNARIQIKVRHLNQGNENEETTLLSDETITTNEQGEFSLEVRVIEGINQIEVCAADLANNQDCKTVTVDYLPVDPCVNITSSEWTSDTTYLLNGNVCTSVNNLRIESENQADIQANLVNYAFSIPIIFNVEETQRTFRLVASTETEEDVLTEEFTVSIDTTPAEINIISPENNTCTNEESVRICARIFDFESGVNQVLINQNRIDLTDELGEDWWENFCIDYVTTVGQNVILVEVENYAGSIEQAQILFDVDFIAPTVNFNRVENSWYAPDQRGRVQVTGEVLSTGCDPDPSSFDMIISQERNGIFEELNRQQNPRFTNGYEFSYENELSAGRYKLDITLRDQAGNERAQDYIFAVDELPPNLALLQPTSLESTGQNAEVSISFEVSDQESGIDVSSIFINDVNQQATEIPNTDPPIYSVTSSVEALVEGILPVRIRVSDQVGNENVFNLTYLYDQSPPNFISMTPLNEAMHSPEVFVIEANDEISGVHQITINGEVAIFNGLHWVADAVTFADEDGELLIEIIDLAGNRLSDITQGDLLRFPSTAEAYTLRGPDSSFLTMSNGQSQGHIVHGEWVDQIFGMLAFVSPGINPNPVVINPNLWDIVYFDLTSGKARWNNYIQTNLPLIQNLAEIHQVTVDNILTLFTINPDEQQIQRLHAWQMKQSVRPETSIIVDSDDDDHFVEVSLGLPNVFEADWVQFFDWNLDGYYDLLAKTPNGLSGLTQVEGGIFQNIASVQLNSIGLNALNRTHAPQLIDLNQDHLTDVLQVSDDLQTMNAYLATRVNQTLQYQNSASFPSQVFEYYTHLDWDQNAHLDLMVMINQEIVQYQWNANTQTWSQNFTGIQVPVGIKGILHTDIDMDEQEELCVFGTFGIKFYQSTGEINFQLLPDVTTLGTISQVNRLDVDADGDDDLSLVTQNGIWLLLSNPKLIHNQIVTTRAKINRGLSHSKDALGAVIYIDRDRDGTFDRVMKANTYGDTLIVFRSDDVANDRFDLVVRFEDRFAVGGHEQIFGSLPLDATIDVVDSQVD